MACALSGNLVGNAIFTFDPGRAYFAASVVDAAAGGGVGLVGWRLARGGSA